MRQVIYMAHPVTPNEAEISRAPHVTIERGRGEYEADVEHPIAHDERVAIAIGANLRRAIHCLAWLRESFPGTAFIAPCIPIVQSRRGMRGEFPDQRAARIADGCAAIERCDGIALMGDRVSDGMARMMEHGVAHAMASSSPGSPPGSPMRGWALWVPWDDREPSLRFDVYDLTSPLDVMFTPTPASELTLRQYADAILERRPGP